MNGIFLPRNNPYTRFTNTFIKRGMFIVSYLSLILFTMQNIIIFQIVC